MSIISPPFSGSFVSEAVLGVGGFTPTLGCHIYQLGNIIMIRFTGAVFTNGGVVAAGVANGIVTIYGTLPANYWPTTVTTFSFPWRITADAAVASNTTAEIQIALDGVITLSVPTASVVATANVNAGAISPSPVFTYCLSGM